jgi:predicted nucleic acid-binding protein
VISDACSLILLAKATILEILANEVRIVTSPSVYQEAVVKGEERGYLDALIIKKLASQKIIEVIQLKRKRTLGVTLGKGEKEILALAQEIKFDLLLLDDKKAISVSKSLNLPFTISPKVVVNLAQKEKIGTEKAIQALEILRIEGRYSPEIIAEALLRLK